MILENYVEKLNKTSDKERSLYNSFHAMVLIEKAGKIENPNEDSGLVLRLKILEQQGLIRCERRGLFRKKVYELTDGGIKKLTDERERLKEFVTIPKELKEAFAIGIGYEPHQYLVIKLILEGRFDSIGYSTFTRELLLGDYLYVIVGGRVEEQD